MNIVPPNKFEIYEKLKYLISLAGVTPHTNIEMKDDPIISVIANNLINVQTT